MRLADEFNYRNAKAILQATTPRCLEDIYSILGNPNNTLDLARGEKQQYLSTQMKRWFVSAGWKEEQPAYSVPGMHYDLLKDRTPIEIEIGHERLVFPDFFRVSR
jgi:hypothetical protein